MQVILSWPLSPTLAVGGWPERTATLGSFALWIYTGFS